jgi:hypothetical protein
VSGAAVISSSHGIVLRLDRVAASAIPLAPRFKEDVS